MNYPLISIITITYNSAKTLERTILSVLQQDYPNIEYLIIDGGSSDGTLEMIKKYENQISYWISEPDKGIFDAMNKGIKLSKGELIGTLNSDDWLEPNSLKLISDMYKMYQFEVFAGAIQIWNHEEKESILYSNSGHLKKYMSINHPATYIKKEIYNKFGYYNLKYRIASDYELLLRLYQNNVTFFTCKDVITNMSLGGISDDKWVDALRESKFIKSTLLKNPIESQLYFLFLLSKDYLVRKIKASMLRGLYKHYKQM